MKQAVQLHHLGVEAEPVVDFQDGFRGDRDPGSCAVVPIVRIGNQRIQAVVPAAELDDDEHVLILCGAAASAWPVLFRNDGTVAVSAVNPRVRQNRLRSISVDMPTTPPGIRETRGSDGPRARRIPVRAPSRRPRGRRSG